MRSLPRLSSRNIDSASGDFPATLRNVPFRVRALDTSKYFGKFTASEISPRALDNVVLPGICVARTSLHFKRFAAGYSQTTYRFLGTNPDTRTIIGKGAFVPASTRKSS